MSARKLPTLLAANRKYGSRTEGWSVRTNHAGISGPLAARAKKIGWTANSNGAPSGWPRNVWPTLECTRKRRFALPRLQAGKGHVERLRTRRKQTHCEGISTRQSEKI